MPTENGVANYSQKRLRIRRSIERVCEQQITRILHSGKRDTFEYTPEELRARHRRRKLGPALSAKEKREMGLEGTVVHVTKQNKGGEDQ